VAEAVDQLIDEFLAFGKFGERLLGEALAVVRVDDEKQVALIVDVSQYCSGADPCLFRNGSKGGLLVAVGQDLFPSCRSDAVEATAFAPFANAFGGPQRLGSRWHLQSVPMVRSQ